MKTDWDLFPKILLELYFTSNLKVSPGEKLPTDQTLCLFSVNKSRGVEIKLRKWSSVLWNDENKRVKRVAAHTPHRIWAAKANEKWRGAANRRFNLDEAVIPKQLQTNISTLLSSRWTPNQSTSGGFYQDCTKLSILAAK